MALPKLDHPTRRITIPSTGQKVSIRPFTVKEEKILLIAHSSKDADDISDAMKQVINNCIVTVGVDIDRLAIFDIEYLFIKLRAFSVNNVVELRYKDPDDGNVYDLELDLNEVEVKFNPDHKSKIELTDDIGVVMRYPDLKMVHDIRANLNRISEEESEEAVEALFSVYAKSIDKVWDAEGVAVAGQDFDESEAVVFLESLPSDSFALVQKFFDTMPVLSHDAKYMTTKGEVKTITLTGMDDFFL